MDKRQSGGEKLLKNTGFFFVGTLGAKILTYLLIPFYTSILSTYEFGVCDTVFTTVSLIYPLFTLTIGEAVFRFSVDKEYDLKEVFSVGVKITIIGFVFLCIVSPVVLVFDSFKPYIIVILLYYLSTTLQVLLSQFVKAIDKVAHYSISSIIGTFVILSANIVFLKYWSMGISGYLWAYTLGNIVMCLYLTLSCKLYEYISFKKTNKTATYRKEMLKYSIPIIPNAASWWISTSSDKYILNFFSGLSVTGIYSVAYKIPSLMTLVSSVFLNAWQIAAVEEYSNAKKNEFYSNIYHNFSVLLILIVSCLICGIKFVSAIMFSKDFFNAWKYVPILLMAYLFHDLANYLGSIYNASKETKQLFISTLIGAITNIILNLVLIPLFSAMGAAVATLISFFVVWLYRILTAKKIVDIDIHVTKFIINCFIISFQCICVVSEIQILFFLSLFGEIFILMINYRDLRTMFFKIIQIITKRGDVK